MKLLWDASGMIYFIVSNSVIKALIISFSFIESGVLDECKSCVIIFKSALEYADFKGINNLLADNCQYINVERNILKNGKIEVYDFLNSMAKRTRDDNFSCVCTYDDT